MMATVVQPMVATGHVVEGDIPAVARFLEDQIRHQSVRFVLAQRTGEAIHAVNEWPVTEILDVRTTAHDIYNTGLRETQVVREGMTYAVLAFRADTPAPVGRHQFRIEAAAGWFAPSDAPDERGVIGMLMRHTESSSRLSLGHSREIVDQYQVLLTQQHAHDQRLLEQAHARIRVLEARETEALELRDKLQSHSAEREAQLEALRRKDEMRKFAMEKLGPVVPLLMAKLVGSGSGPVNDTGAGKQVAAASDAAGAHVEGELAEKLFQSLTPDQLGEVARLLTPEQLALFGQLYELVEARIRQRAVASPSPTTSPSGANPGPAPETKPQPPTQDARS
jgi:hypothetical protein